MMAYVNYHFLEGLFPIDRLHNLFYFQLAFAGSGKVGNEVLDVHHSTVMACRGGREKLFSARSSTKKLIATRKPTSWLFLYLDQIIFFYTTLYMIWGAKYNSSLV
jgi:hypothetical protein